MLCPKFTRLKGYFGKLIAHILRSIDEHLSKSSFSFSKRNSFYNLHRYSHLTNNSASGNKGVSWRFLIIDNNTQRNNSVVWTHFQKLPLLY